MGQDGKNSYISELAVILWRQCRHQAKVTKLERQTPTLRKIKRAAMPPASRHKLQHILFCPTHRQRYSNDIQIFSKLLTDT